MKDQETGGILEQLKKAKTKKNLEILMKKLGGYIHASPKTRRKANRIFSASIEQLANAG